MALGDLAGSLPLTADTFFAVAETCPDAIVLADESGQIVYLNQAATRTFGYPPDEALGRPLTLLIPDRFHQAHSEGLSRYLATGTSKLIGRTVEVPARRKDGKEFPVELSLGSWKQGGKSYFAATIRDISERRELDQALARSKALSRALFDSNIVGIITADMIGNILEANDAFLNLVGYTREELLAGKVRWEDMTPPEYKSLDAEKVRQLSEEGRIPAFEKEYIHKDGHRIPILLGAALLPGFRDTCIAFVLDLTERKASELERSRLAAIVESSSDAILAKTLDGTITSWNPAAERLYGYTAPEAVGRSVGLIIPPDRHAELRRILERIARGERIEPFETLRRRKDGQSVDVSLTVSPLRDASGKIVGASSIARDITDVKRAHDLLARSEERFRIAAESTTDLIWEWDVTAGTLEWYGPVDACLGYAPGEFPRSLDAWEKAIHPGERARVIEALDRHLKERVPYEAEYRVFRKDGSIRVWTDRGRALFNAAGQAVKMVGACADVTEKRALEEELREARKMEALGQLAGGVAHNFNNLMQGVLGYSELALERLSEEDPVRKDLEEIRKASQRASDLTQRILAYGRKQFLRPSVFDINEVIRDLVRMLGPLVPSKIAITTESWPSPLLVKADKGMVEQAILNLALNARDAMPHGGTLAFRTELAPLRGGRTATGEKIPPGDYVSLAVRDTGLGMTSETLAHLFEPFFTTKGLAGGTGLGLATTHGTVRQSGGHIFVQSGKGQGTTFTIYLPVASGHVPLPAGEPAEEEETSQGGRVLLAEDDAVVRFIATSALRKLGYQVHAASDGEEGVKLAETLDGRLDLIVTDVIMPGLRGPDMVRRLRSKGIEAPVLYVSGFTETALKEEGLPAGPWQFLGKPFSVMQLAQKLKEVRRGSAGS